MHGIIPASVVRVIQRYISNTLFRYYGSNIGSRRFKCRCVCETCINNNDMKLETPGPVVKAHDISRFRFRDTPFVKLMNKRIYNVLMVACDTICSF